MFALSRQLAGVLLIMGFPTPAQQAPPAVYELAGVQGTSLRELWILAQSNCGSAMIGDSYVVALAQGVWTRLVRFGYPCNPERTSVAETRGVIRSSHGRLTFVAIRDSDSTITAYAELHGDTLLVSRAEPLGTSKALYVRP